MLSHIFSFCTLFAVHSNAFVVSPSNPNRSVSSISLQDASTPNTVVSTSDDNDGASLTFSCQTVLESESLGTTVSPNDVTKFFQLESSRNCMITAGNQRPIEECKSTPALAALWEKRCAEAGASVPDDGDVLLKVTTGGIKFPGLTLSSLAYIGSKLVLPTNDDGFPVYEFTLIKDEQTVSGLKPAVWIFNRLTSGDKSPPMSLSRVSATTAENGQTKISFDCQLTIRVDFPEILLKILPVTREKAETQGSEAISKTLLKDLDVAIKTLTDQFQQQ